MKIFIYCSLIRSLINIFESADTKQKQAKKRGLGVINEQLAPVFNTVAATQIVLQRPAKLKIITGIQ